MMDVQSTIKTKQDMTTAAGISMYDNVYYLEDLSGVKANWHNDITFIPSILTYGLTFTLGIVGNGLVIFGLLGDRKARNVTSSFLVSLAIADLVFLLVCVPYETAEKFLNYWTGGRILCKLARFVEMLSAVASVLNLTAVSIERYIVIVHSMRARLYCTMGKSVKFIVCVWVASLLLASPALLIMDTETTQFYNNQSSVVIMICAENYIRSNTDRILFAWYQLFVMFILPVFVMIVCYAMVIRVLWVSNKMLAEMTQSTSNTTVAQESDESRQRLTVSSSKAVGKVGVSSNDSGRDHSAVIREARKQVIKMLLTIIGIFFFCWGPKLVLTLMKRHALTILHTLEAFWIMLLIHLLPFIQSCINPIIYSFMSKNIRRSMRTSFIDNCNCDPTKYCRRPSLATLNFVMGSRSQNGMARSTSFSRIDGSTSFSTVTLDCKESCALAY